VALSAGPITQNGEPILIVEAGDPMQLDPQPLSQVSGRLYGKDTILDLLILFSEDYWVSTDWEDFSDGPFSLFFVKSWPFWPIRWPPWPIQPISAHSAYFYPLLAFQTCPFGLCRLNGPQCLHSSMFMYFIFLKPHFHAGGTPELLVPPTF
jgi:hypothetical protein